MQKEILKYHNGVCINSFNSEMVVWWVGGLRNTDGVVTAQWL